MLLQHADSVYALALNEPLPWLRRLPRRLLLWPTGLFQSPLGDVKHALATRAWRALAVYAGELAVNLAWWVALGVALIFLARKARVRGADAAEPWVIVLVFACGNLILVLLLLPTELRFGYLWFALAPAAIFCVLSRLRGGVALALTLAIGLVVPQLYSPASSLSGDSIDAYRLARRSARQLADLLGALPERVTTVYLIDDMAVQSSSPEHFARLSGFRGQLILVNNLAPIPGCKAWSAQPPPQYRLAHRGAGTTLEYHAPECFQRAWNVAPLNRFDQNNAIRRGDRMSYHFPDLSTPERSSGAAYELGRQFTVRSTNAACTADAACIWLGFDPAARRYYALPWLSADNRTSD